jgi:two-component system, NtrC family, response regulator AtoC
MIAGEQGITEQSKSAGRPIIAESRAMREILNFIQRVAGSEASSFLIEGENGTGKDLVATTLHYQSPRKAGPFLAINCAAIPETLLESELFGYEKGAFTDARAQKRGLIELADRGTLFLDEIDSIPHSLQAKLLRVLENQSLRRLGGIHDLNINIRIIAATNRDLRQAVKEGAFRQDLYYRLNVIQIFIPPLRDRTADVLPLAQFFIEHYNQKFGRRIDGVTEETRTLLVTYNWPGNVRELRNTIEHAMILEETTLIQPRSLPADLQVGRGSQKVAAGIFVGDWMSLPGQERRLLLQALGRTGGNQTHAAKLLHITRDTLRYRMKKFHLD